MRKVASCRLSITLFIAAGIISHPGALLAHNGNSLSGRMVQPSFAGRWQLDLTRMPDTYGPAPKQVIYAFQDIGGGQWRTTIDITAPDGSLRHSAVTYRPDGSTARGEGDTSEADSAAVIVPAPDVLVLNLAKNRMPRSVRVYTLSAGGSEMTESAAAVNDAGDPYIRTFRFKRLH